MQRTHMKTTGWLALVAMAVVATASESSLAATPAVTAPATPPASASKAPAAAASKAPPAGLAFARLVVPKHKLYVGEKVPITMQAYYAAGTGVTITGTPTPSSPDFTLAVGDATQGRATIGGDTFLVVSWKGQLSPAKAGTYALRITTPTTLEWQAPVRHVAPAAPTAPRVDPFAGMFDPFGGDGDDDQGDPFAAMRQQMQRMQQMMGQAFQDLDVGPIQKKDVILTSPSADLTVVPLPTAGRPTSFSGAVGHFELASSLSATDVRAGEPVELRLVVHGQGNLDRMTTSGLPDSKELKTYAPIAAQKDDTKTFTQALVPARPGPLTVPPVEVSYFDPDAARYVTMKSDAVGLDVRPGQALAASAAGTVPDAAAGPTLAPNADAEGRAVATLRPPYARRSFWLAQLAPFGLLAAAASLVVRRRRHAADPHHLMRLGARRALRKHRAELDAAFAAGDAPKFFAAARGALQQRLGSMWGLVPEAITLVEIERRLDGPNLDTVRAVFEKDAARFGVGADERDLSSLNDAVRRVLANPEAS
jgi:hypothetical protein